MKKESSGEEITRKSYAKVFKYAIRLIYLYQYL